MSFIIKTFMQLNTLFVTVGDHLKRSITNNMLTCIVIYSLCVLVTIERVTNTYRSSMRVITLTNQDKKSAYPILHV